MDQFFVASNADGNMQVVSNLTALTEIARKSKTGIAMHKHPMRSCAHVEAETCIASHRGNRDAIKSRWQENIGVLVG